MTEMGAAYTASQRRTDHVVTGIFVIVYHIWVNWLSKTRPSAAGVILVFAGEQRFACGDIHVDAFIVIVPVLVCERSFFAAKHDNVILQRSQSFLQLFVAGTSVQRRVYFYRLVKDGQINVAVSDPDAFAGSSDALLQPSNSSSMEALRSRFFYRILLLFGYDSLDDGKVALVRVINARAVADADIVALSVNAGRVNDFEEAGQQDQTARCAADHI